MGKSYTRLERGEQLQLSSWRIHEPEYVGQMWRLPHKERHLPARSYCHYVDRAVVEGRNPVIVMTFDEWNGCQVGYALPVPNCTTGAIRSSAGRMAKSRYQQHS